MKRKVKADPEFASFLKILAKPTIDENSSIHSDFCDIFPNSRSPVATKMKKTFKTKLMLHSSYPSRFYTIKIESRDSLNVANIYESRHITGMQTINETLFFERRSIYDTDILNLRQKKKKCPHGFLNFFESKKQTTPIIDLTNLNLNKNSTGNQTESKDDEFQKDDSNKKNKMDNDERRDSSSKSVSEEPANKNQNVKVKVVQPEFNKKVSNKQSASVPIQADCKTNSTNNNNLRSKKHSSPKRSRDEMESGSNLKKLIKPKNKKRKKK